MSIEAAYAHPERSDKPSVVRQPQPITGESTADVAFYRCVDLQTRDEIVALAAAWRALETASQGSAVFQAFDFCMTWLDAYVFGDDPSHHAHVLAFYNENDALVALAPFARDLSGFAPMVQWIGEPLLQYGDILMDPGCERAALRQALSKAIDAWNVAGLHLRNVRADARIHDVLELQGTQIGQTRQAALVDLTKFEDATAYFDTFSKSSKKNRRRKRRLLCDQGALTLDEVKPGADAALLCQQALDWKVEWLAERGLSSRAFMDGRALKALVNMLACEGPSNPFRLFVQRLDGTPIAIEIGLVGPQGNVAFMGTYDPAYEARSAGKVQMESSIFHGFEQGWKAYDMLAPLSDYKRTWTTSTIDVADHMVASTLSGLLYRDGYLRGARPLAKAMWDRLPAWCRALILRRKEAA